MASTEPPLTGTGFESRTNNDMECAVDKITVADPDLVDILGLVKQPGLKALLVLNNCEAGDNFGTIDLGNLLGVLPQESGPSASRWLRLPGST